MNTYNLLPNQTVLLVGASGDIGQAMAKRFVAEGAVCIATARNHPERLAGLAGENGETAARLIPLTLDVTDDASVQAAYEQISQQYSLDALVYNAGIVKDGPVLGLEDSDWKDVIEVNLNGAFRIAKAFGRIFFRKKAGRLLFVSSVAGRNGGRGQANYAASKGGLEAFVRSLAADLAPRGILVNAIAPGPIESKMTRDVMNVAGEEVLRRIALKRLGKPDEVAAFAAHLLTPDITFCTGQTFAVDGGFGL